MRNRLILLLMIGIAGFGQVREEYRAFWADTFNTALNNRGDIVNAVNMVKDAGGNAIFAQVRRRGDTWALKSLEKTPDFVAIEPGFDPLEALVSEAHAKGIEVHAFVILGAIWNKNPTFAPTASLGAPLDPKHVFNKHGGFDRETGRITPGPENWLTRTLVPDGTAGITFQGHRFGSEFWLDFGHPDAAAYTVDVLMELVKNYDIDGLHLDRIRFPEFAATRQTPRTGASIGYNAVSVERFQKRFGGGVPEPGDPVWAQWRRDQVTQVVRRIYLNAVGLKPRLKVSGAFIVYGDGPAADADWVNSEAYWRVYQDWRAWLEEGIIDIAIPMNYKREHVAQQAGWAARWDEFTKRNQYGRMSLIGLGVYLNSIEGTLRQMRRAAASGVGGVALYALANVDTAVAANPLSLPAGQNTPARGYAEFRFAVKDANFAYEDGRLFPLPLWGEEARVRSLPWKERPVAGHVMGFVPGSDGAEVVLVRLLTGDTRRILTDGGGFFGAVDLAPGQYEVRTSKEGVVTREVVNVEAGWVTKVDLVVR